MANRQRAEARRKAAAKAARSGGGSKGLMWLISGIVAAVVLVVVVVVATGGDTQTADGSTTTSTSAAPAFPDSQPVEIEGDSLVRYDKDAAFDDAVGTPAPQLTGKNFSGDEIVIDPAANGPYMLVFLAHWCPHCNAEMPVLLDWKNSGGVPPELNIVGIATAVSTKAPNYPPYEWFSSRGWSWPVLVDTKVDDEGSAGTAATAFGASGWPYFVIIGADGLVKVRSSGELPVAQLQQIVDDALAS